MQYKSFMQVVEEARDLHASAQKDELWQSKTDRQQAFAKAERCYHWLLEHQPENSFVLGALGSLCVETGRWGLGCSLLLSAARIDPGEASYWNALGAAYRRMDMLDPAREALKKGLGLAKDDQDRLRIMHNLAGTYVNEGEPAKAVEWAKKALAIEPDNKACLFNLGLAQLELGDYANGWDNYEKGGRMAVTWARNYSHPGREVVPWDGSAGKRVVVFGEQGVGDEILFAHAIPDLIKVSKSVIIDCHPRLVELFKRSFPDVEAVYGTRKEESINWPASHKLDAKVPFGSLHKFFRRSVAEFPVYPEGYIKPDPAYVDESRADGGKLKVGISWIGGTRDTHVRLRSMPLKNLAPLLSVPGVEFHSLQYTEGAAEEVAAVNAALGCNVIHDLEINEGLPLPEGDKGERKGNLDKLMGRIAGLDLVITVLTSNVHFAGSMNVPTWVLTPVKAPWQFMQGSMPWYPRTKLYRQHESDDWSRVISKLAIDLRIKAEAKRACD